MDLTCNIAEIICPFEMFIVEKVDVIRSPFNDVTLKRRQFLNFKVL